MDITNPTDFESSKSRTTKIKNALGIGAFFLVITVLSLVELIEILPRYNSIITHPIYPYVHESHDVLALMLVLYLAHQFSPKVGILAAVWFLIPHIPYVISVSHQNYQEFFRLILLFIATLFGIQLISLYKKGETKLKTLAISDPLTDLYNRRFFQEALEYHLENIEEGPGAILFLDLDKFKIVNDSIGHLGGDELLIKFAKCLEDNHRVSDVVARLGGDEFAVILPYSDLHAAETVGVRLLKTLSEPFTVKEGKLLTISASIGIALFPEHSETVEGLLACADKAMYRAKYEGRNRYCIYSLVDERVPAQNIQNRRFGY